MTTFKLQHGPVTITVEGLPATVRPESVTLEMGIHAHYEPGGYSEHVAGFVRNFGAMGGRVTFPGADPEQKFSCRSEAEDRRLRSRLILYPPDLPVVPGEEAIRAALNGQEASDA